MEVEAEEEVYESIPCYRYQIEGTCIQKPEESKTGIGNWYRSDRTGRRSKQLLLLKRVSRMKVLVAAHRKGNQCRMR